MQWPFVSRALYLNVLRQLAAERRRAADACADLKAERVENGRMVRHLTNMLLRKAQSYPLADKAVESATSQPMQIVHRPKYDAGELAALVTAAKEMGRSEKDAIEFFMKEKGLDASDLVM